jgi:hypothetical protein
MAPAEIVPLAADDVEELGSFLTKGFGLPADCDYFRPASLRWKYFESNGNGDGPRSYISRADGRIIGHFGLCPRKFGSPGNPELAVPSAHGIDWLVSTEHRGVGACLMIKALGRVGTLYSIGGSTMALPVLEALKFEQWQPVQGYRRILRPLRRLGEGPGGLGYRLARLGKDLLTAARHRPKKPAKRLTLQAVAEFGPEVQAVYAAGPTDVLCPMRSPELLNYFLRYPDRSFTAWSLCDGAETCGFAVLRLTPTGGLQQGKVVECYVASSDPDVWHAAYAAVTEYFCDRKADYVSAFSSTPWADGALESCGFHVANTHHAFLHDMRKKVPRTMKLHLSMLEGDNALLD